MTRLIGRTWVPMVMVAVGAFTVSRLRGVSAHRCAFRIPAPLIWSSSSSPNA
jgi:hypothetical protein